MRFLKLQRLAIRSLAGPRSVSLQGSGDSGTWFEPVLRIILHSIPPAEDLSFVIFSLPNCVHRDPSSPVIFRYARWDANADKNTSATREVGTPSVSITWTTLPPHKLPEVDEAIGRIDASLATFPYRVEGLDLKGASGFKPLPDDATLFPESTDATLKRVTRFYSLELRWQQDGQKPSALDRNVGSLVRSLEDILRTRDSAGFQVVEKYEEGG